MGKPVVTKGIPELNKKLDGLIKFIKSPRQAFKDSELIMHSDILRHFQREKGLIGNG